MNRYILIDIFTLFIGCTEKKLQSEQSKMENLAASLYNSEEEPRTNIFTPDVIGKKYSIIIKLYGEPSTSILVNSKSAMGRMPLYLVNYLN